MNYKKLKIQIKLNHKLFILFMIILWLIAPYSYGQGHETHHEEVDGHTKEHAHFHKQHLALFAGATSNFTHTSTDLSIGIDYEYRLNHLFGLGLAGEYIATGTGEIIAGVPFFIHPANGLKFTAAPLLIFIDEHHEEETDHHEEETGKEAKFALRAGAGYSFHFGKISVGPTINFDIGDSKALVYGVSIGIGF